MLQSNIVLIVICGGYNGLHCIEYGEVKKKSW